MKRLRGSTLAGVVAALGGLLVVFGVVQFSHRSIPAMAHVGVATRPVYLDDGIVFSPKPLPADAHYLTADAAWVTWEDGHHLGPDTTADFGMLNDQGRYHLAWGFSERGCSPPLGFPTAREVALARSPKCREWTFLNPRTGRLILTAGAYPTRP